MKVTNEEQKRYDVIINKASTFKKNIFSASLIGATIYFIMEVGKQSMVDSEYGLIPVTFVSTMFIVLLFINLQKRLYQTLKTFENEKVKK